MNIFELQKLVNEKKLPADGYKGTIKCRVTGVTGKLRYYYVKGINVVAVITPCDRKNLLNNDEILAENILMVARK